MYLFGTILLLLFLFYTLAKAADVLVNNVRLLARQLGINVFFLGMILGVLTSVPELSIAINSAVNKIPDVSHGNLIGGIPVAIGLILGMNAILQRKISTREGRIRLALAMPLLMLPVLLGLDGAVSSIDSALLIISYALFMFISFRENRKSFGLDFHIMTDRRITQAIGLIIASLIVILLTSNLIVRFTMELLHVVNVPPFFVGLVAFSIGTNIPEIAVALRAWRSHAQSVSLSNLMGSALANLLILGILSFLTPVTVSVGTGYYLMTIVMALMLIVFAKMYRSGNKLTRREGFVLVGLYALFVLSQVGGLI